MAYAVATITPFGTLAVLIYPFLGGLMDASQSAFGAWAGTAVNDTSQVVATGYAYGTEAGDMATVVKLTCNLLIGPTLLGLGFWAAAAEGASATGDWRALWRLLRKAVPLFVLGFVGMAILNTFGLLSVEAGQVLREIGTFLISMAVVAIGLNTSVRELLSAGLRPLASGFVASALLAAFTLAAVVLFWT